MEFALAFAMQEIPLVLFTALAPSGTVCMVILMVMLLTHHFEMERCPRLNQVTWVPLAVTTVGLVAAAASLGTPANALYVVMGVGRSPLSNEVACAVVFLATCGVNWLLSFAQRESLPVKRAFAVAIIGLGVVFLASIAGAYSVETIATWSGPLVPANLILSGLVGGALLARATILLALDGGYAPELLGRLSWCAAVALVASVACLALQWFQQAGMSNAYGTLASHVPVYPLLVAAYTLMVAAAIGLTLRFSGRRWPEVAAIALAFGGLLVLRFGFYLIHMTPGLAM
ncbi:MAG: dimethyl sulfoxide reductase anchor subunit [Coriobacteriia bacterium]|nr:dimethyl sulfoxide reductase anchor subunit [Coriobacteriia bacterium]